MAHHQTTPKQKLISLSKHVLTYRKADRRHRALIGAT